MPVSTLVIEPGTMTLVAVVPESTVTVTVFEAEVEGARVPRFQLSWRELVSNVQPPQVVVFGVSSAGRVLLRTVEDKLVVPVLL